MPDDRRLIPACLAIAIGAVFFSALFLGEQFSYRDTSHFYYPLFEHIQAEWQAGRVPLWNPYESSGTPLLANPTASVFYPGKLLFFLPGSYGLHFRLYIVLHVVLCAFAAYRMASGWGGSRFASGLCAISYALSGIVLAQCSNVVFLVGAAWTPFALSLAHRALAERHWRSALGMGTVLALQVLGGDPQIAYLCGLLAALYALFLWRRDTHRADGAAGSNVPWYERRVTLLASAALTGIVLSLVQLVPTSELASRSERAASALPRNIYDLPGAWMGGEPLPTIRNGERQGQPHSRHDALLGAGPDEAKHTYRFSTGPWRWPELIWPGITGRRFPTNRHWPRIWPDGHDVWVPSLYLGIVPLLLAASAFRWRGAPVQQVGLSAIALLGVFGALGRFGPVWLARLLFGTDFLGRVGDELGGLYWALTVFLPGFADFRYPAKLLVFAALGAAGLAAYGWDRWAEGHTRGLRRGLLATAGISLVGVAGSVLGTGVLESWLGAGADAARDLYYGPFDAAGARWDIQRAFLHTAIVTGLGWLALRFVRRQRLAIIAVLLVASVDLVVANRWIVQTSPQSSFESLPTALEVIREHERQSGSGAPFRIYRPAVMFAIGWGVQSSEERVEEILRFNRNSLKPKFGLRYGIEDMAVRGTLNLQTYHWFYTGWPEPTDAAARRRMPELPPTTIRHSALAFDAWNVKYFVLPRVITPPMVADQHRSIQSFLYLPSGQPAPVLYKSPYDVRAAEDYQVVLNPDHYPRAWMVHAARGIRPLDNATHDERLQHVRALIVDQRYDLRRQALVESDDPASLAAALQPKTTPTTERVEIVRYEPGLVEIEVEAQTPGLLVLADTHDPGWTARVDDTPAAILRTNLMMRGVTVPEGHHRIVFVYQPRSFWWSAVLSGLAWLGLGVGAVRYRRVTRKAALRR